MNQKQILTLAALLFTGLLGPMPAHGMWQEPGQCSATTPELVALVHFPQAYADRIHLLGRNFGHSEDRIEVWLGGRLLKGTLCNPARIIVTLPPDCPEDGQLILTVADQQAAGTGVLQHCLAAVDTDALARIGPHSGSPAWLALLAQAYPGRGPSAAPSLQEDEQQGNEEEDEEEKEEAQNAGTEAKAAEDEPLAPTEPSLLKPKLCALGLPVVQTLKNWFQAHLQRPYPNADQYASLEQMTGATHRQVMIWFANTRKRYWLQHPTDPTLNTLLDVGRKAVSRSRQNAPKPAQATAAAAAAARENRQGRPSRPLSQPGPSASAAPGKNQNNKRPATDSSQDAGLNLRPGAQLAPSARKKQALLSQQVRASSEGPARLRAWARAHITHPYPNEGQKQALVVETGLSWSQLKSFFVNYRERSWAADAAAQGLVVEGKDARPMRIPFGAIPMAAAAAPVPAQGNPSSQTGAVAEPSTGASAGGLE